VNSAATANDPSNWWQSVLVCPRCSKALESVERCLPCGLSFELDDGTPKLIAAKNSREVSIGFEASRSFMLESELLKVFRYPPLVASSVALPYHVDAAHACFILGLKAGSRILEIGCGGGQSRAWYLQQGFQYVGTDISKTRVPELLQRHGGPDLLCDVHFLPFADGSMDVVYASAVFEHLACPILAAKEIFRVLKPGGAFLGNASFLEPWHDHSYFHFSPLGAHELLTASGFILSNLWPGRGYSGFRAISRMTLRNGLRWIGGIGHYAYLFQNAVLGFSRRVLGRSLKPRILEAGAVAGAIDWIALKPQASA
jgi:SAM-dependent methyltransferase